MVAGSICALSLEPGQVYVVFVIPILVGAGTATLLVQSLAIMAALIGENATTSAFVYGAMSLTGRGIIFTRIFVTQLFFNFVSKKLVLKNVVLKIWSRLIPHLCYH